jgi:hypothetical protein
MLYAIFYILYSIFYILKHSVKILKITTLSLQTNPPVNVVPRSPNHNHHYTVDCDHALSDEHKYLASLVGGKQYVKKEVIYAFNSIHWGLASRVSREEGEREERKRER